MDKPILKIIKMLKEDKKFLYLIITLSILLNLVFIVYINFVKNLINSVIEFNMSDVFKWVFLTGLVLVLDILFNFSMIIYKKKFYCNVLSRLRMAFFKKINNISLPVLERYLNADLITRFTDDLIEITKFISGSFIEVISNAVLFMMLFVYIGLNDWRLLPIVVILLPVTIYTVKKLGIY
ncbi:hypothetical protein BBF96_06570 [Anoxybacter fermentans]|uniref:ABC transmembrane type-1 domain-containing protein n=1 Tax=Anoxybacter fermentans TaxID=1323375 RepID=A0A3S9SXL9_9FIRM|nr:ABC transporter transmembrane domain-containing protein [Anoxybacter fermentans]AZR73077.1 hypothetical protein BBF96_06570 [Anoxybacter fermentans]